MLIGARTHLLSIDRGNAITIIRQREYGGSTTSLKISSWSCSVGKPTRSAGRRGGYAATFRFQRGKTPDLQSGPMSR